MSKQSSFLLVFAFILAACQGAAPAVLQPSIKETPTLSPTLSPTFEPTQTPTPEPTATPEMGARVIGVEALSLKVDTQKNKAFLPKDANQYLLGMKFPAEISLDGVKLAVGSVEIIPEGVDVLDGGKEQEIFFSIPRGTKQVKLQSADGIVSDISKWLPEQEPENMTFQIKPKERFVLNGVTETVLHAWVLESYGYCTKKSTTSGKPCAESVNTGREKGYIYFNIAFRRLGDDMSGLKEVEQGARFIDIGKNGVMLISSWDELHSVQSDGGVNTGLLFKIPSAQKNLKVFIPGVGVFDVPYCDSPKCAVGD